MNKIRFTTRRLMLLVALIAVASFGIKMIRSSNNYKSHKEHLLYSCYLTLLKFDGFYRFETHARAEIEALRSRPGRTLSDSEKERIEKLENAMQAWDAWTKDWFRHTDEDFAKIKRYRRAIRTPWVQLPLEKPYFESHPPPPFPWKLLRDPPPDS